MAYAGQAGGQEAAAPRVTVTVKVECQGQYGKGRGTTLTRTRVAEGGNDQGCS